MRFAHVLSVVLAVVALAAPTGGEDWAVVDEHWYVFELQGVRAGWMSQVTASDGARFRTETETSMQFGRAGTRTEVAMRSSFIESEDGRPVELEFRQRMSEQDVASSWRFDGDRVEQRTRQGGRETTRTVATPEPPWLTPQAAHRYRSARCEAGADTIVYRMVDPQNGLQPITVTMRRSGVGAYDVGGRTIPVTKWISTSDRMPLKADEQYSSDGFLVHQAVRTGVGTLVTRLSTRAEATRSLGDAAPPVLVQSFVQMDAPIRRLRRATSLRLRLTLEDGQPLHLVSAGAQRVEDEETGAVVISIEPGRPRPAPPGERDDDVYRNPSPVADAADPAIVEFAARAARPGRGDPAAEAEALRRAVHGYVARKDLGTAFATASETIQTRTGDCSEHAVLLCAALRARNIPARVATGLVYADEFAGHRGIFAWHMWTQALVDGAWIDLDATERGGFHPGHVLVSTSSLAHGAMSADLATLLTLMGNLRIEVLDIEYGD